VHLGVSSFTIESRADEQLQHNMENARTDMNYLGELAINTCTVFKNDQHYKAI
jgi:hypothetical protein